MESVLLLCKFSHWTLSDVKSMDFEEFSDWCELASGLAKLGVD